MVKLNESVSFSMVFEPTVLPVPTATEEVVHCTQKGLNWQQCRGRVAWVTDTPSEVFVGVCDFTREEYPVCSLPLPTEI